MAKQYREIIERSGRTAAFRRVEDTLAGRIRAVRQSHAVRYGWAPPTQPSIEPADIPTAAPRQSNLKKDQPIPLFSLNDLPNTEH